MSQACDTLKVSILDINFFSHLCCLFCEKDLKKMKNLKDDKHKHQLNLESLLDHSLVNDSKQQTLFNR